MNGKSYKKFLQEKLVSWFALLPDVRAAPKAGRASLAGDDKEADEGEEGRFEGELSVARRGVMNCYPLKPQLNRASARENRFHIYDFMISELIS